MNPRILYSREDRSVNFVFDNGQEARYVRRNDEYAIIYLSSHGGCNQACRFCHLTQQGQTDMTSATVEDFVRQARWALGHYADSVQAGMKPVSKLHFNWMARGEPLLNPAVTQHWPALSEELRRVAMHIGDFDSVVFNISTIMPMGLSSDFLARLPERKHVPTLFYSLYSVSPAFRKRWLPKAVDPEVAMRYLSAFENAGGPVVLHWSYIESENDSAQDSADIVALVQKHGLRARFNLVRYNPYSPAQGKEPSNAILVERFAEIEAAMQVHGSRIVPRVGRDVAASCGMFIPIGKAVCA